MAPLISSLTTADDGVDDHSVESITPLALRYRPLSGVSGEVYCDTRLRSVRLPATRRA
jgi:hypothetical protein